MFKKILIALLIGLLCFQMIGCSGEKPQPEEEAPSIQTPIDKINASVLIRPETNEDFRYNVYTYYVTITQCLSTKSNIVIPDTIHDLPVYQIDNNVFNGNTSIVSVTMTNNLIKIGDGCFENCENLSSVILSKNLMSMGGAAFRNCVNLKTISIPASLQHVPGDAFRGCSRLVTATIDGSTERPATEEEGRSIDGGAFADCVSMKGVWIPGDCIAIDDSAFGNSMESLVIYGQDSSAAAQYAANHLVDFRSDKGAFKDLTNAAITVNTISLNENLESNNWKISFNKTFVLRDDFDYKVGNQTIRKSMIDNEQVILMCFSIKNMTSGEQFFNPLDVTAAIDGYHAKVSYFGEIAYNQLSQYNRPLIGAIAAGATFDGYIALDVGGEWDNARVLFANDMELESELVEINSSNKNVVYIGTSANPSVGLDTPAEPTSETAETNTQPIATTDPVTETAEQNSAESQTNSQETTAIMN